MHFDPERVLANVRKATTEDLLDRVTVYRAGMEPQALDIIEAELTARGVSAEQIREHAQLRSEHCIRLPDDTAARCSFCDRPAVEEGWDWHRLWGILPVFPRTFYYCERHRR